MNIETESKQLPVSRQSIDKNDVAAVSHALHQDFITRGSLVEEFEKTFAEYCGAEYAVSFNSGTSALDAAYFAAGVKVGDRLLAPPNTFVSTVGAAVKLGATPVFVDIDLKTGNIDLEELNHNVNQPITRGRIIVAPVHFSGIAVDIKALERMIQNEETLVIEDAAHALGSIYPDGTKVGSCSFSDITIFSMHPAKNITTGEGGMCTTNNPKYYERLKAFRCNGIVRGFSDPWFYEVQNLTGNYHLTDFQAALGSSQLERIDLFIERRRALMKLYRKCLSNHPTIRLMSDAQDETTAFHLCVAQIDFEAHGKSRAFVMEALKEKGIGTQVHYIPVYKHPVFAKLCGDIAEYYPKMEEYYAKALSLPLFYDMEDKDVERVVTSLIEVLG